MKDETPKVLLARQIEAAEVRPTLECRVAAERVLDTWGNRPREGITSCVMQDGSILLNRSSKRPEDDKTVSVDSFGHVR